MKKHLRNLKRYLIENASRLKYGARVNGKKQRKKFTCFDDLLESHFSEYSERNHICRRSMELALSMLHNSPSIIVETGSAAWGTNSSLLFDSYVNSFGGSFQSVDIRAEPMHFLVNHCSPKSTFYRDDSINFLKNLISKLDKVDLVYLDSKDLDMHDPLPSAIHGFNEFLTIFPILSSKGGLLLVDDTPIDAYIMEKVCNKERELFQNFYHIHGFLPGKAGLIKFYLEKNNVGREIFHEYQLLWEFPKNKN